MSPIRDQPRRRPYEEAHRIAFADASRLLREADLDPLCRRTGARRDSADLAVRYFGRDYRITLPEVAFEPGDTPAQLRILILHYLTSVAEAPTRGEHTSFRNLPDGSFYQGPYSGRTTGRILRAFQGRLDRLVDAAKAIGGEPWDAGDYAARLTVFPRIDAVVVAYDGDDEFPPDVNILYSDNIINFLTLEDVAVLGGDIASRLTRVGR